MANVGTEQYGVYRASNGICYLRVGVGAKSAQFIFDNGKAVELVDMANNVVKARQLQPINTVTVIDAATVLAHPMGVDSKISKRAKVELDKIFENKELVMKNANAKAAKKAAPVKAAGKETTKAAKGTKAPKAAAAKANGTSGKRNSYAGQKITVLNKEHGAREGSKRALLLDAILASKTTDQALEKSIKFNGATVPVTGVDFKFAVDSKLIKLSAA